MYYLKSKTDYQGVQNVDIYQHISYDTNSDQTIIEKKIIGQTVVECKYQKFDGDKANEIYQNEKKSGWEESSKTVFESFNCTKSVDMDK